MKLLLRNLAVAAAAALASFSFTPTAVAGPFILAGTDADDHGFVSGGVNQDGWFFMQRALENLAPAVTNGNKQVVFLGTSAGTALTAAQSAFNLSNLPGAGWTAVQVDGVTAINDFFAGTGAVNVNTAGIIMMDSGANVGGGASAAEQTAFTANATGINNFLGAGGGLFSQSQTYGWVSALVPGLTVVQFSNSGLTLTPAGNAAFPGLTNADLSAGPWHNYFTNTGALPILATGVGPGGAPVPVILGAQGGTVTQPGGVPDSGSFIAVYIGLLGALFAARRHMVKRG